MTEYSNFTLPNGIRCVHRRVKSPVANIGITINAGTRDEGAEQHGVAHLVEHLLFKGTESRSAYHVNNRLESVGGELNAFTTKEETVVHATSLKQDYVRGVDLLADMIFRSIYPEKELEKEREVIIDEINSYKDSPSELIFDEFEELLFADTTLGRNILGSKRNLRKATRGQLVDYTGRTYNTDQMVFSSSANISHERFRAICEKYLGCIAPNTRDFERVAPTKQPIFRVERYKKTYQTHCLMGGYAYDLSSEKRILLAFLINILGGASSLSRLNMSLREKHALTYNVEASYTPYTDSGIYTIYFGCENQKAERSEELVRREIALLRDKELSPSQLARAKKQFVGQLVLAADNSENFMLSIAKSILIYNEFDSMETIAAKINSIQSGELLEVAKEIFTDDNIYTLIYR